jgi:glutamate-1-semialdehyde aminotransferase
MEAYNASIAPADSHVPQIGTLSGNPVAATAGLATLKELRSREATMSSGRLARA